MPTLISEDYRRLNAKLHEDEPNFGARSYDDIGIIVRAIQQNGFRGVLDYGCGKGTFKVRLAEHLPEVHVEEYDPAISGKDGDPKPQDLVIVMDVMEHIESDCVDAVLAHIGEKSLVSAIFLISNKPASKTLPDGRNAHLTVEAPEWWESKINAHFDVLQLEDMGGRCLMGCARKRV
jgi:hypothetical protein